MYIYTFHELNTYLFPSPFKSQDLPSSHRCRTLFFSPTRFFSSLHVSPSLLVPSHNIITIPIYLHSFSQTPIPSIQSNESINQPVENQPTKIVLYFQFPIHNSHPGLSIHQQSPSRIISLYTQNQRENLTFYVSTLSLTLSLSHSPTPNELQLIHPSTHPPTHTHTYTYVYIPTIVS